MCASLSVFGQAGASGSKSAEVSLRVTALDHLGSIAARLRKQDLEGDITEPVQNLVAEVGDLCGL